MPRDGCDVNYANWNHTPEIINAAWTEEDELQTTRERVHDGGRIHGRQSGLV